MSAGKTTFDYEAAIEELFSQHRGHMAVVCEYNKATDPKDRCWGNLMPEGGIESVHDLAPRPFVGTEYARVAVRILSVGLNQNGNGGYGSLIDLVDGPTVGSEKSAKTCLRDGQIRVNFGNEEYSGTTYWHRVPWIAGLLLKHCGQAEFANLPSPDEGDLRGEDLVRVFDFIAVSNLVKCSPHIVHLNEAANPSWPMRKNCGRMFLAHEIAALEPHIVILLGEDIAPFMDPDNGIVSREFADGTPDEKIMFYRAHTIEPSFGPFMVCWMPHPTRAGASENVLRNLLEVLTRLPGERFCDRSIAPKT